MATWRYIKGSEKDFEGAPEWVTVIATNNVHAEKWEKGARWGLLNILKESGSGLDGLLERETLIAQRERVTSINDDRLARDMGLDNVNHPKHYTQGGIECIDAIKAATVGKTGIEATCVANVVKYLWRYEEKNGVEDVKKARWYLERLISELESDK